MNREPINPDDPQMTAYALGELTAAETAEFEARLQSSPMARAELASMREVMDLLSDGLRGEWVSEQKQPELTLLEPLAPTDRVVEGRFRPVRRHYHAAAAAVVGMLLVGGIIATSQKSGEGVAETGTGDTVDAISLAAVGAAPSVHVPQLFLAEEVDDVSRLDLADESAMFSSIDASYLDAGSAIPVSATSGNGPLQAASERGGLERVDSYLPPLPDSHFGRFFKTGMIEKRLRSGSLAKADTRSQDSVLVSGYVTMGGAAHPENNRVLAGFQPVSISGNPVVNEEADLQLLADLHGLQKDLSEVIGGMSVDAAERSTLESILEENRRIISQLKRELTR
ncbi:MAG: hypothetical protein GXX91_16555 [Verrucomicrobiaceae bacterium]|nr:hypothetical protein [Verrucomicrobiaceae bacterium]